MTRIASVWRTIGVALLVFGFVCRLAGVFQVKAGLSHDESVSYLCAAATQGDYERTMGSIADRIVPAAAVQRYYARPDGFRFGTVAADLAAYDIHPPLYFWVLHAALTLSGMSLWLGAVINVAFSLCMLALLYRIGLRAFGAMAPALAVCVIWYLSPAVVQIDLEARHYQLFGLLALLSCHLSQRLLDDGMSWRGLSLLVLVNAAGFLTHYYYGFVMVPAAIMVFLRHGFSAWAWRYFGGLLLSLGIFLMLFPQFFQFVGTYLEQREAISEGGVQLLPRAHKLLSAHLEYFAHGTAAHIAALVLLLTAIGWIMWKGRSQWRGGVVSQPVVRFHAWQLAWCAAFTLAFYLMGITPLSAAGEQYSSYLWPSLSLLLVAVARTILALRPLLLVGGVHFAQLAITLPFAILGSSYVRNPLPQDWYSTMDNSEVVYVNDRSRATLPRVAFHLRPTTPLLITYGKVDHRKRLAEHRSLAFLCKTKTDSVVSGLSRALQLEGYHLEEARNDRFQLTRLSK